MVSEGKSEENKEGGCMMWTQDQTIKTNGFDPSLPVMTRDGRKAIFLERRSEQYDDGLHTSIIAFIKDEHNPDKWVLRTFCYDGRFFVYADEELYDMICGDDLVNCSSTKVKKDGWINIYTTNSVGMKYLFKIAHQSGVYKTRAEAEQKACDLINRNGPGPNATIRIEWEEEQ